MSEIIALILTGGTNERMNSRKPDALHEICGKPMLDWVFESLKEAGIDNITALTCESSGDLKGFESQSIDFQGHNTNFTSIAQLPGFLRGLEGDVLVVAANMPLIKGLTFTQLIKEHKTKKNDYTACCEDLPCLPSAQAGSHEPRQKCKELPFCCSCAVIVKMLEMREFTGESTDFYTDFKQLESIGCKTGLYSVSDPVELLTIEDRMQLALANGIMRQKLLDKHLLAGVSIIDTMATYIDADVRIGRDTVLYPGSFLEKGTMVGENCIIGPNSRLRGCVIGNEVEITSSVVLESKIGDGTHVGPFAYIRPDSQIGENVKIGDFVEVKKSTIGNGSKVSHLTYVGDAEVGKNVNLGCGVVFVNYNGKEKNKTVVKDNAFIGCNVNLVSPVVVKENAYIAAGSTITEEVPENSLAVARSRQVIKEGWVDRKGMNKKAD